MGSPTVTCATHEHTPAPKKYCYCQMFSRGKCSWTEDSISSLCHLPDWKRINLSRASKKTNFVSVSTFGSHCECSHPRRSSNVPFTCTQDRYSLHNSTQVGIALLLGNSSLKVIALPSLKWFSLAKKAYLSQTSAKSNLHLPVSETAMILMASVFLQPLAVVPDSAGNPGPWHLILLWRTWTSLQKPYGPTEALVWEQWGCIDA